MAEQWWSWALTLVGATCFILAGGIGSRKVWWAWYVGLAGQLLWLAYSLLTQQWGFLAGVAIYTAVYVRNAARWTREHRAEVRAARVRSTLVRQIADQLDVPAELIMPAPRRFGSTPIFVAGPPCTFHWRNVRHPAAETHPEHYCSQVGEHGKHTCCSAYVVVGQEHTVAGGRWA